MTFNPELCRNESEVESKLIVQYLLPKLGYPPDSWHQEVVVGSIRLDFLAFAAQVIPFVLDANSPLSVVIEAKHPNQNLNNHVRRLKHYLTALNVQYGLLTNGKEIRIFKKIENDVHLVFQCSVKEVNTKINEIKTLIGRDSLKERSMKDSLGVSKSQNNTINTQPITAEPIIAEHNVLELELPSEQILDPLCGSDNFLDIAEQELKRIEQLYNQNPEEKRQHTVKTIAVYHNKGGVGKTTVAVNLAAALRKKGKSVLLIDIDSQANTTFATGLIKFQFEEDDNLRDSNIYHVLESGDYNFIQNIARQSHHFNNPEVDVIPSHINLIEGQYKLNQIGALKTRLITKLKKIETEYDVVIIDTPPSRDLYAQVALITADSLIIPSDLKPFANQGLISVKSFIKEVNEFREIIGKPPIILMGVLPSKIATNPKFLEYTFPKQRRVIPERYNLPLMETVIHERTVLSECTNQTISVGDLEVPDPKSIFDFAESKPSSTPAQTSAGEFELLAMEVLKKMGMN